MLKADTEWKRENRRPLFQPSWGKKRKPRRSAPSEITTAAILAIERVSCTSPLIESIFNASLIISLSFKVIFLPRITKINVAEVIKPRAPTRIRNIITNWPKTLKYVPVSTTVSPVTQTAEAAVNNASMKLTPPVTVAKGSNNKAVPVAIIKTNPAARKRAGDE